MTYRLLAGLRGASDREGGAALLRNAAGSYQASTTAQDHVVPLLSLRLPPAASTSSQGTGSWGFPSLKWRPDTCHLCSANRKHPAARLPEEGKNQNNGELGMPTLPGKEATGEVKRARRREAAGPGSVKHEETHAERLYARVREGLKWERHHGREEEKRNYPSCLSRSGSRLPLSLVRTSHEPLALSSRVQSVTQTFPERPKSCSPGRPLPDLPAPVTSEETSPPFPPSSPPSSGHRGHPQPLPLTRCPLSGARF